MIGKNMASIDYEGLAIKVRDGLRKTFTELLAANPERSFYTFAIWTDDSLQFAHAAANTEEGLTATVHRYNQEVDPKNNTTSTHHNMRWSYGDWEFFPVEALEDLADVNSVLQDNFLADEDVFEEQIAPLWRALLDGFKQLEAEGFFGTGPERSKITLLLVGNVLDETFVQWVTALNPESVAQPFLNWDCDASDAENFRCPKCQGEMKRGFVLDHTQGGRIVSRWSSGQPKKSFRAGTQFSEEKQIPIGTFRCKKCGYLESFARPEFEPD